MFAESTPKCQQNRRLLRICGDHEVWPTWRQNSFAHDQRSYSRRWHQSASHKWSTSVRSNLAKCRIATTAGNFIDFFNKNQSATDRLTHGKDTCIFQYRYRWRAIKPAGSVKMHSPYSITERPVPELIPVLCSQPAGDVSHKPGGRLSLLSARPAVTPANLKRAATNFAAWWREARWVWTVCLRQRRGCDLNPSPSAPESSRLIIRFYSWTISSATADGPRDALCQSASCQLLHNCRNKLYNESRTNRSHGVRGFQSTDV